MKVLKALNNNIILAIDENGKEVVLFGTGIGFKKKKDDVIVDQVIQKKFVIEKEDRLSQILSTISSQAIDITEDIIKLADEKLDKKVNDIAIISLSDHIRYAIERVERGIEVKNPLQWEIPHLYPKEYEVGVLALKLVREKYDITLFDAEASFITMHIINAQFENTDMDYTMRLTETISKIINIVNYHYHISINELGMNYSRFVTHLRYFVIRQKEKIHSDEVLNHELYDTISTKHEKSFACAQKIAEYLSEIYNWRVSETEIIYLVLHIERLIQESQ
ncbi:beta-glucoside operon transcriptional antiterminator [Enterococcus sp. PF1-24]|uniref:PRD domain-containing protein n=1 Tax=unclassified Enterococcus TaxID=2608891 RepID=UPI0024739456|nr:MULTISPECIES: PRD domain-containing protein [unclassified Enterococcus]MDH6363058.1 beta-glucoside operon transcriptional antiterminator [Enterococcus sp. PFB1-1]MDH6400152.1 beta-glucoside operon transcriptional antiterminator [Enterococcus sp. PF1-24]